MRAGRVHFYRDRKRKWRWRIVAANGNVLADSGQGYSRRFDCLRGFMLVTSGLRLVKSK